ncbi:MAG TPA: hypothetical protein PKC43_09545 [Phycisphaerales bacterium]|nr:hypothetical protein [Phycisphaerales bacterium]HMP37677.1 hypothetical protein [Phycisphaerales bacterium]
MARTTIGYDIGRFTGTCAASGVALEPGSPCVATLADAPDHPGFVRRDYAVEAWEAGHRPPGLFSFWRTEVPRSDAPRRLLVDDDVLIELFRRLESDRSPERAAFRFVLGLVLLRRRLLRSVGREREGEGSLGQEVWLVQVRGALEGAPPLRMADPGLSEADVQSIAEQLGEIVAEDA